jgi:MscS family membrane protein
MQSCQEFIGRYATLLQERLVSAELVPTAVIEDLEGKISRCFDLSAVPRERVDDITSEVAIYLQEVLDRIELPVDQDIPDAAMAKAEELASWRVPGTEISIAKVKEGPREGEWLFSSATVAGLRGFYADVESLPYRPDALVGAIGPLGGMYVYSVIFPEAAISADFINALPSWTKRVHLQQPVWKWLALVFVLFCGGALFALILLACRRRTRGRDEDVEDLHWESLFPPVSGVILALLADHLIDEIIGTTGSVDLVTETALWVVVIFCSAWSIFVFANLVAEAIILSPRINPKSVDASLIAITGRVVGLAMALWVLIEGAENLGLSLVPILAGLGVGGLAIARAVRPTFENLIGGFILFIDKPVRVGDRCRFGAHLGDVEAIGLRSTRIRTRENTLLSVPNAEFSNMQLENISQREYTLYQVTLALRYETTPEQLRFVLAQVREMLLGHPKVTPHDLRVRFINLGEYSLDVEIFAYTRTNAFQAYWAIREDLNLRVMEIVREAGTGFAFPSTTEYRAADTGLDADRGRLAEERVREWRVQGKLPFPDFEKEDIKRLEDILDYPPKGSPYHAGPSRSTDPRSASEPGRKRGLTRKGDAR